MVDLNLINDINTVIGYTAKRTSLAVRKMILFPRVFLGFEWVKEQIKRSVYFSKLLELKKSDIFGGYMPKTQIYFRKLRRILLSKPLFKHTSYNLVIDLFLFNNKGYKFRMVKNLLLRRSTYKYMYSMYSDYYNKNLNLDLNSNNIDKNSKVILKKGLYYNKTKRYSKLINKKRLISYIPLKINIRQTSELYNVDKKVVHPTFDEINLDSKKKVKKLSRNQKSQYLIYKKYFVDLERRSHEPIDLNSLTL